MIYFYLAPILLFTLSTSGCSPKKDEVVTGNMIIKKHMHNGRDHLVLSKKNGGKNPNSIILSFDKKGEIIELVTIEGGANKTVYIDVDSKLEPVAISVARVVNGLDQLVYDFGALGTYDMIINPNTGNIEAVALEEHWIPAKTTDRGIEIQKEGDWFKVEKSSLGFQLDDKSQK